MYKAAYLFARFDYPQSISFKIRYALHVNKTSNLPKRTYRYDLPEVCLPVVCLAGVTNPFKMYGSMPNTSNFL